MDWFSNQELVEIFHQKQLAKLFTRSNIKKAKKFGIFDPTMRFIAATLFKNRDALDYNLFVQEYETCNGV